MKLTAVEPRRGRQSALFLDGEYAVSVDAETLLRFGWKPGREVSDEELHTLLKASDARRAREKAMTLLEHRSHSQKELENKVARFAGREAAASAAEQMAQLGLVNDRQYARDYASLLLGRKGFSPHRARQELAHKGIDRETIDVVLEELWQDPVERIAALLDQKYSRSLGDEKGRRRTIAALQRLGWRWEDIKAALRRLHEEDEEWE